MSAQNEVVITWETLNLCIGTIFEAMETRREFTTADVASMLNAHGVKVVDRPDWLQSQNREAGRTEN